MRVLGLDLGSKTLGMAQSDLLGVIASSIGTYRFLENQYEIAVDYIINYIKDNNINEVVIGMPKHMNGDIGIRGNISLDFGNKIKEILDIKVVYQDERLTTKSANSILISGNVKRAKRKQVVDQLAATIILQTYLDTKNR